MSLIRLFERVTAGGLHTFCTCRVSGIFLKSQLAVNASTGAEPPSSYDSKHDAYVLEDETWPVDVWPETPAICVPLNSLIHETVFMSRGRGSSAVCATVL